MTTPQHKGIGLSLNADLIDGDMPTLERHLGIVADSGAEYVELILHGLDVVIAGRLHAGRLAAVQRILDRFELGRTLHLPYELNLMSSRQSEAYRRCFEAGLDFAAETGCEAVTYHSSYMELNTEAQGSAFYARFGRTAKEQYGRLLAYDRETLSELASHAAEHVVIGVENTAWNDPSRRRGYGGDPREIVDHIAAIESPRLGLTLDLGHLNMSASSMGRDIVEEIRAVREHMVHIHVHDNFGDSTPTGRYMDALAYGYGDLHLPVGWGTIPWGAALPMLAPYRGVWTMEIEFRLYPHFLEIVREMRDRFALLENT